MTEKWGEALVSELIPKGVKLMRKPPVEFGDMVEAGISKSLRARQERGATMKSFERQVGRSDNQAVAVQLNDQLLNEVSNLQDKLSSAGCPKDTEHPWFQRELAEQFFRGVDDALRQHIELELRKK